jgi:ubiquinone biosynthesis protein
MFQSTIGSKIKNAKRLTHIIHVFAKNGFLGVLEKSGLDRLMVGQSKEVVDTWSNSAQEDKSHHDLHIMSHKLRQTFEELGPVFVKLGQMLSSRDDIIPESIVSELKQLHQAVTPLSYETVDKILSEELSDDAKKKILKIQEKPLAAGSIGQVHKASLSSGEQVVLKVRRPGIDVLIEQDIALLKILAKRMGAYFEEHFKIDIVHIINALGRGLEAELDFSKEATNTESIARNFSDWENLVIPKVYWELSTKKVLVLQFISGESAVQSTDKAIPEDVLSTGVRMFMKMIFVDGAFHADLHPGNLMIIDEQRVGIIDFGLVYRLLDSQRLLLAALFGSLLKQDFETLGRRLSEVGEPLDSFDVERFQLDLVNEISPFFGVEHADTQAVAVILAIIRVSAENDLLLPAYLVMIFKTLISLEGIASKNKGSFDLFGVCDEITVSMKHEVEAYFQYRKQLASALEDSAYLAKVAPHQIRKTLRSMSKGNMNLKIESQSVNDLSARISNGLSVVSVSLVFCAVLVSASILISSDGEVGSFASAGFIVAAILGGYLVLKELRR